MPKSFNAALIGTLLRERRLALGLKQAEVAAGAGISPSYLNLLEHNRRRMGPDLLARLADLLGSDVASLAKGAGSALLDDLRAAAAMVPGAEPELDRTEDFAGRFPGWAAALAATAARAGQLERLVAALNDRITHDPHLSAALHEVLSSSASVRSTAAILAGTEDIDPDWRARFHRNLHQDSERLAVGAEALVAYLDSAAQGDDAPMAAPQDEVEGWLAARGWQLAELEATGGAELLRAEVAGLASGAARRMAAGFLDQAAHEARLVPEAALRTALAQHGDDPAAVASVMAVPVLTVMRRMALLPDAPEGLVICDASGTLLFRKPIDGFALPRFGAACPLWPLFTALGRPMAPVAATLQTAGRAPRLFAALAISETHLPQGFAGPELRLAAMLLRPLDTATGVALGVGTSCRICPRAACPARREPSILTEGTR
jgi:transcriptional regulator with XRE-family HTH domain